MKKLTLLLASIIFVCNLATAATPEDSQDKLICNDKGICTLKSKSCGFDGNKGLNTAEGKTSTIEPLLSKIHWQHFSPALFQESQKTKKPVFIFSVTENCQWSRKMASITMQDSRVIKLINQNFIPVLINFKGTDDLAIHYKIKSFPTVLMVDENDKIIKELTGFIEPKMMVKQLEEVSKSS